MEKLKVMFISAASNIHTVRWVNALSENFEIHLAYCKNHKPDMDIIDSKVFLHELDFKSPFGYYLNALQLRKLFKDIKPNIVNVHYASGYGTLARVSRVKPVLLSIWGSDVYDFPNESRMKKKILKKNVEYAKCIASTSNAMADELRRQFPALRKEIFITPFGVDVDKFSRKNVKRTENEFTIGNVKTLEPKYGIKYAILAVNALKNRLQERNEQKLADSIKFYIYGEGKERPELEKIINDYGLNDTVFLKGKIPNNKVPGVLNKLDVFCATSILNSESFGVAVVEAMACELPVIATKVDGFSEVMEDNVTGMLVEKQNVEQISYALEKLLRNPELRMEYGKNGRKRVLEKYNWKDNVEYMKETYYKIYKETN